MQVSCLYNAWEPFENGRFGSCFEELVIHAGIPILALITSATIAFIASRRQRRNLVFNCNAFCSRAHNSNDSTTLPTDLISDHSEYPNRVRTIDDENSDDEQQPLLRTQSERNMTEERNTSRSIRLKDIQIAFTILEIIIQFFWIFRSLSVVSDINGVPIVPIKPHALLASLLIDLCWMYTLARICAIHRDVPHLNNLDKLKKQGAQKHLNAFYLVYLLCALARLWNNTQIYAPNIETAFIVGEITVSGLLLFCGTERRKQLPILSTGGMRQPTPEITATLFSKHTFNWFSPLLSLGRRKTLTSEDLWDLAPGDDAEMACNVFTAHSSGRPNTVRGLLVKCLLAVRPCMIRQFLYAFFGTFLFFTGPYFLSRILHFLQNPDSKPVYMAVLDAMAMFVGLSLGALCNGQIYYVGRRIGLRVRAMLIGECYRKTLRRRVHFGGPNNLESMTSESVAAPSASTGEILNIMQSDTDRLTETSCYLHYLLTNPIEFVICTVALYKILGWSGLVGIGFMTFIIIPLNGFIARQQQKLQKKLMHKTDKRIEVMSELLQGIRAIKFFAWEKAFAENVDARRTEELATLRSFFTLYAVAKIFWFSTPLIVSFVSFATYTKIAGHELDASVTFVSLSLFSALKHPINILPDVTARLLEGAVSLRRISKFLAEEEQSVTSPNGSKLGFENASFDWESSGTSSETTGPVAAKRFILRDLTLDFPIGRFSIITGKTGSGKSSLLYALLGEMRNVKGNAFLPSRVMQTSCDCPSRSQRATGIAYVPQQAWLQHDTIRGNILFGMEYDARRYDRVVEACCLIKDFKEMDDQDLTEIGEKGVSLSGGQKQRISLARAVYSDAQVLLLDDVLSAVDAHTQQWIYDKCITSDLMKGRTVVLVTHSVGLCLPKCDYLVLMREGRAIAKGSIADIKCDAEANALLNVLYNQEEKKRRKSIDDTKTVELLADLGEVGDSSNTLCGMPSPTSQRSQKRKGSVSKITNRNVSTTKRILDETQQKGRVRSHVFRSFMRDAGGLRYWALLLVLFIVTQVAVVSNDFWLREWSRNASQRDPLSKQKDGNHDWVSFTALQWTISSSMSGNTALSATPFAALFDGASRSNSTVSTTSVAGSDPNAAHSTDYYLLIYGILNVSTILFLGLRFALQYSGSLRVSRDIHSNLLDSILRAPVQFFDRTPIGRIMNRFSKDIHSLDQELMNVSGEFFRHLFTSISVLVVICTMSPWFLLVVVPIVYALYSIADYYLLTSRELKRIDATSKSPIFSKFEDSISGKTVIRAFGAESRFTADMYRRVDNWHRPFFWMWVANRWLGVRVDITGAIVTTCTAIAILLNREHLDPGFAGLALVMALSFTDSLIWVVRFHAQVEMSLNSVERCHEYREIEKEAPNVLENGKPPNNWPSQGKVEIENLVMRYSSEDIPVIRGINLVIPPHSRVGIVGRTGAGKSTLALAFFRILEPTEGRIRIDGIDIQSLGLNDLRSRLNIIPQDPVLFRGTIRSNLDPFNQYSELECWTSLRRVHFIDGGNSEDGNSSEVTNSRYNLDTPVTEGGTNFSLGQRQLLSLARSLLRASKIVIMDEATASVDAYTDALIQKTIRKEFHNATLLCIAHRLKTVCDYDRVVVMDAGRVAQYDTPLALMKQQSGIFHEMCRSSGEYETLLKMAETSER